MQTVALYYMYVSYLICVEVACAHTVHNVRIKLYMYNVYVLTVSMSCGPGFTRQLQG